MSQNFQPGDFLVFQLESGYALLRFLATDSIDEDLVWHVAAYTDFFPDVEQAEAATTQPDRLSKSNPHIALTTRAFESTQVAKIANVPLTDPDLVGLSEWRVDADRQVSDRSVRLMLGFR